MENLPQRIHLDPIGGIAGDMFVAALADAFPEVIAGLLAEVGKLPAPAGAKIAITGHRDAVMVGCRFHVAGGAHGHKHGDHQHPHTDYADIRRLLHAAPLRPAVREHALGLFAVLAEAEAEVHGIQPDAVTFHEVGAWDSIVDFVAAAYLIDVLGPVHWTCAPLPLGGGRVRGAHGVLPVPAPATALLLRGMAIIDDGVSGERVTPTGAAILKYLSARSPAARAEGPLVMSVTGNGFGVKTFPGLSNVLRCIALTQVATNSDEEEIAVVTFEVDDQTAEDLSVALESIRHADGVLDVYQAPVFGKKGRMATQIQILARPENLDAVAELCFTETTTLGLRLAPVTRKILPRASVALDGTRVKLAERPGTRLSAKAEMDDVARAPGGKAGRDAAKRKAEGKALDQEHGHGHKHD